MDNPKVYSYLRFSDPKQAAGSSADRQTAYAQRWAAERGMLLDEALSLRDEGLSAYHQRHITQGALGAFLRAVDAGLIAPGSVLVVEGLDRLSRAEPVLAQAQLARDLRLGKILPDCPRVLSHVQGGPADPEEDAIVCYVDWQRHDAPILDDAPIRLFYDR